jgi:hypothetical protein
MSSTYAPIGPKQFWPRPQPKPTIPGNARRGAAASKQTSNKHDRPNK